MTSYFQHNEIRTSPRRQVSTWDVIEFDADVPREAVGIEVREYSTLGEYLRECNQLKLGETNAHHHR